jgi:hypothetical protein
MTDIQTHPKFSAEMWAAFWAAPAESRIGDIRTRDGIVVENVIRYDQVEIAQAGDKNARSAAE